MNWKLIISWAVLFSVAVDAAPISLTYDIEDGVSCGVASNFIPPSLGERFLVTAYPPVDCSQLCGEYQDCAAFDYIKAGEAQSGGPGVVGDGACYFREHTSVPVVDPARICYIKKSPIYLTYDIEDGVGCGVLFDFIPPNHGERFLVAPYPPVDCSLLCDEYQECAGFNYIIAGEAQSGGTGVVGDGACYFREDTSVTVIDPARICYTKKSPISLTYNIEDNVGCGGTDFIPPILEERFWVTAEPIICTIVCDLYQDCAGFNYIVAGEAHSGGHGVVGDGACYFREDTSVTDINPARICYTKKPNKLRRSVVAGTASSDGKSVGIRSGVLGLGLGVAVVLLGVVLLRRRRRYDSITSGPIV